MAAGAGPRAGAEGGAKGAPVRVELGGTSVSFWFLENSI